MANFESGVSSYIQGRAIVVNHFPVDSRGSEDVSCAQCFFFRDSSKRCALTGEVSQYPSKHVGGSCPLMPDDKFLSEIKNILTNEKENENV